MKKEKKMRQRNQTEKRQNKGGGEHKQNIQL